MLLRSKLQDITLRRRSRAFSNNQGLMSDDTCLPSPTANNRRPTFSSLFPSPRLFSGFSPKGASDREAVMSPTSILETKPFSTIGNPFFTDRNQRRPIKNVVATTTADEDRHHPWDSGDSKAIGLGLVDALNNEKVDQQTSKPESRMVMFGSQLKIQIPLVRSSSISPSGSIESPHSPIEFGVKTKNSQLALYSPARRSPMGSANMEADVLTSSPRLFTGRLSPSEMELSEDYTCVISRGPNPRTTHIFENCIVESCGDGFVALRKESSSLADHSGYTSDDFLSYCYACRKNLGQGKDIFMYRGEKAFCSRECRYQEMLFDEEMEKCSSDLSDSL